MVLNRFYFNRRKKKRSNVTTFYMITVNLSQSSPPIRVRWVGRVLYKPDPVDTPGFTSKSTAGDISDGRL